MKSLPRPLYKIEYSQPDAVIHDDQVSPKPMTPRRVKRRSVISRNDIRRSSRRSSVRQSRRKNPINRIMDHQESLYANSPSSNLTNQNVNSLSQRLDRISGMWDRDRAPPNWAGESIGMAMSSPNIWNHHQNQSRPLSTASLGDPPQWEAASSTKNLSETWQTGQEQQWQIQQGQANPTYQPTSVQSLNNDEIDELYNTRPASARSSYSNYHGVRTTPQLPQRTDVVRQSQTRQFPLGGGPPAYQDTVI